MNRSIAGTLCCLFFLFVGNVFPCTAAEEEAAPSDIKEIMDKELELAKITAELKLSSLPNLWYMRRWQLAQITNNTLTSSGAFLNGCTSLSYQESPDNVPRNVVAAASLQRAIANFISTGECSLEFGLETYDHVKNRRTQSDLKHVRRRFNQIAGEVDDRITKLHATNARLDSTQGQIIGQGGKSALIEKTLRDARNAQCGEFAFIYGIAAGLKARRATNQLVTLIANLESGVCTMIAVYGTLTGRGSVANRYRIVSTSGIGDIVGGTMMASVPNLSRLAGLSRRRKETRRETDGLDCQSDVDLSQLQSDCSALRSLVSPHEGASNDQPALVQRFGNLELQALSERRNMYADDARRAKSGYAESLVAANAGGDTKVTNGIGNIIGNRAFTMPTESRLQWLGGTATSYGCGQALAGAITIQRRIDEEIRERRLSREHRNPRQILRDQVSRLSGFQATLRSGATN